MFYDDDCEVDDDFEDAEILECERNQCYFFKDRLGRVLDVTGRFDSNGCLLPPLLAMCYRDLSYVIAAAFDCNVVEADFRDLCKDKENRWYCFPMGGRNPYELWRVNEKAEAEFIHTRDWENAAYTSEQKLLAHFSKLCSWEVWDGAECYEGDVWHEYGRFGTEPYDDMEPYVETDHFPLVFPFCMRWLAEIVAKKRDASIFPSMPREEREAVIFDRGGETLLSI